MCGFEMTFFRKQLNTQARSSIVEEMRLFFELGVDKNGFRKLWDWMFTLDLGFVDGLLAGLGLQNTDTC